MFDDIDFQCVIKVRFDSSLHTIDSGTWYKSWEVATAITAMCIRSGKAGSWSGLGKMNPNPVNLG